MIRIIRTLPAPSALSALDAEDRFSHETVRQALRKMQHDKCCYCERYITDWGTGRQVDHYRPKDRYERLKFDWDNLLLACGECNGAKSNEFPKSDNKEPLILNPYDPCDDPEDHIDFFVREGEYVPDELLGKIVPKDGSTKGKKTIQILKLDKLYLTKSRRETLDKVTFLYLRLLDQVDLLQSGSGDAEKFEDLKRQFCHTQDKNKTYLGLVRAFFREYHVEIIGIN